MIKHLFTVLLTLSAVYLTGCPKDYPPRLSKVCTLDGLGGGDCAKPDGVGFYQAPSEMKGDWCTTQTDAVNLTSWCYGIPKKQAARLVTQFLTPYQVEAVQ